MTDKEKDVITWAFNLAKSVTAGDYGLPRPMNMAINGLQDAVHALASERGIYIPDGCSKEFLEKEKAYWDGVKAQLLHPVLRKDP